VIGRRLARAACGAALASLACSPLAVGEAPAFRLRKLALPPGAAVDVLGPAFPSLDGSCRRLAFAAGGDVYVLDLESGAYDLASAGRFGGPAGAPSSLPVLSADGTAVAFDSAARDLVAGPQNRHDHLYLRRLESRAIVRLSVSDAGELAADASLAFHPGLALSAGGSVAAFHSHAANLVAGDRNGVVDVFVRNLASGRTERASVSPTGEPGDGASYSPSLSADGGLVAFASDAANLAAGDRNGARDVFVRDRRSGRTEWISRTPAGGAPDGASDLPQLSADGRFVAFASDASDLAPGDGNGVRDVFLADREGGGLRRVTAPGREPDGPSDWPAIRADGGAVAFVSEASNLVGGDRNGVADVFLWEAATSLVVRVSEGEGGAEAAEESGAWGLALSGDGRCIAFSSLAANLVPGDRDDGRSDLFLAERR
jgi:hypothetical protein